MKLTTDNLLPGQYHFLQIWLLLISVVGFGLYVLHDLNTLAVIVALDRSYMASLTMALLVVATAHCGWHVAHLATHIAQLQAWLDQPVDHVADALPSSGFPSTSFLRRWLEELQDARHCDERMRESLVDISAEHFRSIVDLGWFFVDLAVRLGLLGTIIGFILIFASLTDINIEGGDDLKALLIAMSGGMGTALLTTLTGLITASILSTQYLILGRASEHLAGLLVRASYRYQEELPSREITGPRPTSADAEAGTPTADRPIL